MKPYWIIISALLLLVLIGLLALLGQEAEMSPGESVSAASEAAPVRIGLIPERDIFLLRKRHKILADYLSRQLGRPVQLVTGNSYETVLEDFAEHRIDAALLGSLITVLCVDRLDAKLLLKTESVDGTSTYHGTICVPEDSSITSVDQLADHSIAMVRTTTAGNLFPVHEMNRRGLLTGDHAPRIIWAGTHDDALDVMMSGASTAAAVKNLRMEAWLKEHPDRRVRVLAKSGEVPENALVVRADLADTLGKSIAAIMLDMTRTPDGLAALREYGAARFIPCDIQDYQVIFDMVADLGDEWRRLGISGPPPKPLQAK